MHQGRHWWNGAKTASEVQAIYHFWCHWHCASWFLPSWWSERGSSCIATCKEVRPPRCSPLRWCWLAREHPASTIDFINVAAEKSQWSEHASHLHEQFDWAAEVEDGYVITPKLPGYSIEMSPRPGPRTSTPQASFGQNILPRVVRRVTPNLSKQLEKEGKTKWGKEVNE